MGVLTDKNIMINSPEASILRTLEVKEFSWVFPFHYKRLSDCVKRWAAEHIADIGRIIGEIPSYDSDMISLRVPDNCSDINRKFEEIFVDLPGQHDKKKNRWCWGLSSCMTFFTESNIIELHMRCIMYNENLVNINKIPMVIFFRIKL